MTPPVLPLADWEPTFGQFLQTQPQPPDPGHDLAHVRRVVAAARKLAKEEEADLAVVVPAAWLHDCVIVPKNDPARAHASLRAAETAGVFLRNQGYPESLIPAIEHAIEAHSFSAGIEPRTLEAAVVQDADRLDALGAIGIARTFMVGGAMGSALSAPHEPFPQQRAPDDRQYALDHFYTQLFTLAETMRTPSGRAEAERRTEFMRTYLDRLAEEMRAHSPGEKS